MVNEHVEVRLADTEQDLQLGLDFLLDQYRAAFQVQPAAPDYLFVAWQRGIVIGTVGMNTALELDQLRLARIYEFDHARAPFPIIPEKSMELCRWACTMPMASARLVHAVLCHSQAIGKEYAWCEHGLAVHRAARRFGIPFRKVPDARIREDCVEPEYAAYYQQASISLYMFNINEAMIALSEYLRVWSTL